jgi:hypothetical protein
MGHQGDRQVKIAADKQDIVYAANQLNARVDAATHGDGTHGYNMIDKERDQFINGDLYDVPVMNHVAAIECREYLEMLEHSEDPEVQLKILIGMYTQAVSFGVLIERRRRETEAVCDFVPDADAL